MRSKLESLSFAFVVAVVFVFTANVKAQNGYSNRPSFWSSWSSCSRSCNIGSQYRRRTIPCNREGRQTTCRLTDRRSCNRHFCSVDSGGGGGGNFGVGTPEWIDIGGWSSCSATCGPGSRTRTRICSSGNNADCSGEPTLFTPCIERVCSASWSFWGQWTKCNPLCREGVRSRLRTCTTGRIRDCSGLPELSVRICSHMPNCPTHLQSPNHWTTWNGCSKSCDVGMQSRRRSRSCNDFGPSSTCRIAEGESQTCNIGPCPSATWNTWTMWSRCSITCGRGTHSRTRTCTTNRNADCGSTFLQTKSCITQDCPPVPRWNPWSMWSICSQTCDTGTRSRTRSCSTGRTFDCPGGARSSRLSENCNSNQCSQWNPWTGWSACTETCGPGTRTRSRTCNSGNNEDCSGDALIITSCNEQQCPDWNPWTNWSACTETCGSGTRTRSRTCNSGNNEDCSGDASIITNCNEQQCPVWSTWDDWAACSATCGSGSRSRSRRCSSGNDADCDGEAFETTFCNEQLCPVWSIWDNWAACTATCGSGSRSRSRRCSSGNDADCDGGAFETMFCNEQLCPEWRNWGEWSVCGATCGSGSRTRRRRCSSGNPMDCIGEAVETSSCNEQECPQWSLWNEWSSCTTSCGGGFRGRNRTCSSGNNEDCLGKVIEFSDCNEQSCPEWSTWNDWSACSASCGDGSRSRERTCSSVNAADCDGEAFETSDCNERTCPEWSSWEEWTECSFTCGTGSRARIRICDFGANDDCVGDASETSDCNIQTCPEWSTWNDWSDCGVTCGPGSRTKSRICSSGSDIDCLGEAIETSDCNERECSQWNSWSDWSSCSYPCGGGFRIRNRTCSSVNNEDCSGLTTETLTCNTDVCPEWNEWSRWSPCTNSCGGGLRVKTRTCTTGSNRDCIGESVNISNCNDEDCQQPEWTLWEEWSTCTATCGGGTQERSRACSTGNDEDCFGETTESSNCNEMECRPQWDEWGDWTSCSATCGSSSRARIRVCPTGNDEDCHGEPNENEICSVEDCPPTTWGDWSPWSECTISCGRGIQQRIRICSTGLSSDCEGSELDVLACNLEECSVEWTLWEEWSTCTATCGGGTQERSRTCSTGNDEDCFGETTESSNCNEMECRPQWDEWGDWTSCSATCGSSSRARIRVCPTGNDEDCHGEPNENEICSVEDCPPATWGDWSPWSECTSSCGGGIQQRIRICSTGLSSDCEGSELDVLACNLEECPDTSAQWSPWGQWSDCDRSCGTGTRERSRLCSTGNPVDCGIDTVLVEQCNTEDCVERSSSCAPGQKLRHGSNDECCMFDGEKNCGVPNTTLTTDDQELIWQWMVLIETPVSSCGGTMINSRWIIAAAHCLANQNFESVQVFFKSRNGSGIFQSYAAQHIVLHPFFRFNLAEGIVEYDVALVELATNVTGLTEYATPICLPQGEDVPSGWQCYITEWVISDESSLTLNDAGVEIVNDANCSRAHSFLRDYMICAAGTNESVCRSDQGRSLMCQMCRSCEWYLVGITTTRYSSDSCGTVERPDVYTRITSIEEWIREETGINVGQQKTTNCF